MRRGWLRYCAALGLTASVVLGRLALDPWWGRDHNRHLVFLPTVMLAAWLGGFGPGVLSATFGAIALAWFWTEPSTFSRGYADLLRSYSDLALFFVVSVAISWLIDLLHRARARADAARTSREQVMAIVAHDLRSPLSTVKMTSGLLRKGLLDAPVLARLNVVDRAVSRIEGLIDDLVDAARIEHGELTVTLGDESIGAIAEEAVEACLPVAREKGVLVELSVHGKSSTVRCDHDRLLQVLGNLLGNAVKFTPAGGRVTLRTLGEPDAIRFEVEDTGPGIDPENISHVFERYWKTDQRGIGLGLFIADSIVRAHGGRLDVRTARGIGTTFSFAVPQSPPPRTAARPELTGASMFQGSPRGRTRA